MMQELAWINGAVMPLEQASVPLEDRGFIFGDGVYEVARIYGGVPFCLEEHLRRLERSAAAVMIPLPADRAGLAKIVRELLAASGCTEGWVYLQLTRGRAPRTLAIPAGLAPTLALFVRKKHPDWPEGLREGVRCITLPDERWLHCEIKAVSLMGSVLSKETARRRGAYDAILYREGGIVTEASAANVFAQVDGVIRTHPLSNLILPGVTRGVVLDLLRKERLPVEEKAITLAELKRAEEIWLTSSTVELLPVVALDGEPVGSGQPGDLARRVIGLYRAEVERCCGRRAAPAADG